MEFAAGKYKKCYFRSQELHTCMMPALLLITLKGPCSFADPHPAPLTCYSDPRQLLHVVGKLSQEKN